MENNLKLCGLAFVTQCLVIAVAIPLDPHTWKASSAGGASGQFMALDASRSHLVNNFTNKPVFITGDAAWSLIAEPSDADVDAYLNDRASQGFNAIIVNLIEHQYADHAPADIYGDAPFNGPSFSHPNERYFAHADSVIRRAAAKGITVFLFPVYLGYGSNACNKNNEGWGTDMETASDDAMRAWGVYVGNRYKSFPNIVYVIGCDADPRTCEPSLLGKLNDVATGIKSADSVHLMTADNAGQQSALDVWSGYRWLDINLMYNSSDPAKLNFEYTRPDFLPFFMDEDEYENEHETTPLRLRTRQYWSVLSGAYLGSFFGNNPIWCFGETNPSSAVPCRSDKSWKSELGSAGRTIVVWQTLSFPGALVAGTGHQAHRSNGRVRFGLDLDHDRQDQRRPNHHRLRPKRESRHPDGRHEQDRKRNQKGEVLVVQSEQWLDHFDRNGS